MDQWISVKERLPENDDWVLVWIFEDHFMTVGYFEKESMRGYIEKDGSFFQTNSGWECEIPWAQKGGPTHWMPLPKPPERLS